MLGKIGKKIAKQYEKVKKAWITRGKKAALYEFCAVVSNLIYDQPKIKKLKMFPPALEDRIVFEAGDDFSDNARALFDYMIENGYNQKYEMIWLVKEPDKYQDYVTENVKFVRNYKKKSTIRRAETYEYAITAKYIFYNQAFNWVGMSRKGQMFIDLWHGCGYKANKSERKVFFDYVLVPGEIFKETKKEFFGCPSKKILALGYPRYDLMLRGSDKAKVYVDELLKKTNSDKMILWMPTYRHATSERLNEETLNNEFNIPIIDDAQKLVEIDEFCREHHILLAIKKHYLQKTYHFKNKNLTNVVYVKANDLDERQIQLYEFIHYADAMISDYSSVAIDYLLMDKPLGFTLDDFDAYTESRGWVFENPLEYMPGNHIYNFEDFKTFIEEVQNGEDKYAQQRLAVKEKAHNVSTHYCQDVLEYFDIQK